LKKAHTTAEDKHLLHWRTKPPVTNIFKISVTPPPAFIRGLGGNPHLLRIAVKDLGLLQRKYLLLSRMYYILGAFGIVFKGLPKVTKLPGTLRKCASLITQIGFSQGQELYSLP
jgi:hypothetical protein